jgi:hypothetical protein
VTGFLRAECCTRPRHAEGRSTEAA